MDGHYKFTVVDIGSYGRNSDRGIFADSKLGKYLETHLRIPEDKQLLGTSCLAPHVIVGDEAFLLETYLLKLYSVSQSKGDNERRIFIDMLSRSRIVVENAFGIYSKKFQVYQSTVNSLPANAENIIFANRILRNYLRDQGLGLSDMGSSANVGSNLTKIPNQAGNATEVLLK